MRSLLRRIPLVGGWLRHDITPPTWSGTGAGARVLIEEEDGALRAAMADALHDAGYQTAECAGPGWRGEGRCPLVEGTGCAAVDGADAVVQVLVASDEPMPDVRSAIRAHDPDLPVSVIVPAPVAARRPDLVAGIQVSTVPLSRRGVVAAVHDAIGPP